ncbi:MAG TPA: deoxyribodipyrimidine photo-lyase [Roseiarcus sp.]|jgi:deoxyribodipyrimidine photo-lyase
MSGPALVWLRNDLRLDDQPAIAAVADRPSLFVYVHDESSLGLRPLGGASRWWLDKSLAALRQQIAACGGRLDILRGSGEAIIPELASAAGASHVFWTRRYGAAEVEIDKRVKVTLAAEGVAAGSFNGQLLREPWEVRAGSGAPFKVFTPFWRRHRALGAFPPPLPAAERLVAAPWPDMAPARVDLADLGLAPARPDWSGGLAETWRPGEAGAGTRLNRFLADALADYPEARDRPDGLHTSMLSPHLRFGEISPRRVAAAIEAAAASGAVSSLAADKFLSELGWREFSYSLLYDFPDLATRSWQPRFQDFPYRDDAADFRAWARGLTGYPIVDAGMRELWATGYMHNRVRMVAASFLIKHLLIDWRRGESWFWDTLCDADPANNAASWQWVAGSGADAAPYFRIFNPVLQGERFDPEGVYVRRWIPELAQLASAHIHAPWRAPSDALARAGVAIGRTYPAPIVDHAFARRRALEGLAAIRP